MPFVKGKSGNPGGRAKGVDYLSHVQKEVYGGKECKITECEVRERFRIINEAYGWFDIALSQEGFPDFVLQKKHKLYRVEVETISKNFIAHKHDITQCDMIICWKNNWLDCPIPVVEIAMEWANYKTLSTMSEWVKIDKFDKSVFDTFEITDF